MKCSGSQLTVSNSGLTVSSKGKWRYKIRRTLCWIILTFAVTMSAEAEAPIPTPTPGQVIQRSDSTPAGLSFTSAERTPPRGLRLRFVDGGTGSSEHILQYLPNLERDSTWSNVVDVVITSVGDGVYQVELESPPGDVGFYRVKGVTSPMVQFASRDITVGEGAGTVDVILLSTSPFAGTIRYSVEGTAPAGDFMELSGEVEVNGNTAIIPLTLIDNFVVNQLRYLTLRLNPDSAYRIGTASAATVTIVENDDEWHGILETDSGSVSFLLRMLQANGGLQAWLTNSGFGFFPTAEIPAQVSMTANSFAAIVSSVPMPAVSDMLNSAMSLTMRLAATNGQPGETVSATEIQGHGEVLIQTPGKPHLDTTNRGTFFLLKPPVRPSTNEVVLIPRDL